MKLPIVGSPGGDDPREREQYQAWLERSDPERLRASLPEDGITRRNMLRFIKVINL